MRCIWQMEGDKVKGFNCDFSPTDMLIVVSGLKYITADIERHPKDRERAQGIYNKIMLGRYHDEADRKTEPTGYNLSPVKDEPQTEENCDYCKMTHKHWYEHCDVCGHKPKTEPQTERSK